MNALQQRIAVRKSATAAGPKVLPDPESRYAPFPLNDMQQAYWLGRSGEVAGGGAGMQLYIEFAMSFFDAERFNVALNRVIERHDMLRAVVLPDGRQQVLEAPPLVRVSIENLTELAAQRREERLAEIAREMWTSISDLTVWPQSEYRFSLTGVNGQGVLHFKIDMWCIDGRSLQILFEDLAELYRNPLSQRHPLEIRFKDYLRAVQKEEERETFARDLAFWRNRLVSLPPAPSLPKATSAPAKKCKPSSGDVFTSRERKIPAPEAAMLKDLCSRHGVSLASCMASAYSEILFLWSGQTHFTVNFPRFNRRLDWHPDINDMIGEFASFTLLEIDYDPQASFADRARAIQERMWEDLEHARVSGIRVLRERIIQTGQPEMQAMPIVFTSMPDRRGGQKAMEEAFDIFGEVVISKGSTPQVWLDCQYVLFNDELHISWDSQDHIFPEGMVEDMFQEYVRIIHMLANEERWDRRSLARTPARQLAVRRTQNNRALDLGEKNVLQIFADVASRLPDSLAIVNGDVRLTYAALHDASLALAHGLSRMRNALPVDQGGPRCAAILLERGWEQIAAVMGILTAGLAYLPLDPETPLERLTLLLDMARPCAVITSAGLESLCREACGNPVLFSEQVTTAPGRVALPEIEFNAPAYIIFTSGTTGIPKGVSISHWSLLNLVRYSNSLFNLGPGDGVFAMTALHHDLSVYDIFGTLSAGAKLLIPDKETLFSPDQWVELASLHGTTFWNSVPMFMEQLLERAVAQKRLLPLKTVVLGGDWVNPNIVERLKRSAPQATLYTIGGPTETTVWNIINKVSGRPFPGWDSLPYGRPIDNASYHILHDDLRDAPDWVPGEMYCGGAPMCLSASLRPEENERAFAVHPETGERLYRTGDLGRYRPDGMIEILGRKDFQLNINGYRLDPAEVEQTLSRCPGVARAVAAAVEENGQPVLGAAIVPATGENRAALERRLREWANKKLPMTMRPRWWSIVDALPLTPNGKVDRKALGSQRDAQPRKDNRPAENAVEIYLSEVWREVLQIPVDGVRSSFFELGGDSLQAMRVFSRVEEKLNIRLPLSQMFISPTIEGLSEEIYKAISGQTH
jgi:amino acid adenylation domain-containing protein